MATLREEHAHGQRFALQQAAIATPEERMARFVALQRRAFALLAASPSGYRHFWQRNLRQRRIHATF